jgi:hypothetical protein
VNAVIFENEQLAISKWQLARGFVADPLRWVLRPSADRTVKTKKQG